MYKVEVENKYLLEDLNSQYNDLLDHLISLAEENYFQSLADDSYVFKVEKSMDKFESLLLSRTIPFKKKELVLS